MHVDLIIEPDIHPRELVRLALEAERLGVRAIWMSNYYAHWDPFLSLMPVAEATTTLRMGVLAISPFETHPMKLANATLTLNELSGGRATIAVGPGEGQLKALDLSAPKKIVGAMRDAVSLIQAAAHRRMAKGFDSEFFKLTLPSPMTWVTQAAPPVYGTAYREQMMRMLGRVADGCFIGATRPEEAAAAVAIIREGIAKRETPPDHYAINAFWAWHVKRDRKAAFAESRRELLTRARLLDPALLGTILNEDEVRQVRDNFDKVVGAYLARSGDIAGIDQGILDRICASFTSTGGIEDLPHIVARLKLFGEAGLNELALKLHDDPFEGLAMIGEHVVPALTAVERVAEPVA